MPTNATTGQTWFVHSARAVMSTTQGKWVTTIVAPASASFGVREMSPRRKTLRMMRREALERELTENAPAEVRKKFRRVRRWRNHHHLTPKSRGGSVSGRNLLLVDGNVHKEWHKVFGNRTLEEVIALLLRVQRAKERQK